MFEIYNNKNIEINIDSPYIVEKNINFMLKVKAYNFYGEHNFCVNIIDLKKLIDQLIKLYNLMDGEIKLMDCDSESFMCVKITNNERVSIYGQFGSEWEDNLWFFKQEVDQTIIKILIENFNKLILMKK